MEGDLGKMLTTELEKHNQKTVYFELIWKTLLVEDIIQTTKNLN